MNKKISSNNIQNNDSMLNNKEDDYKTLITRLKEITSTIALLEKKIFN